MLIKSLLKGLSISLLLSAAFSSSADEFTITFDDAGAHGTVLDNEYSAGGIDTIAGLDITFWAQTAWNKNDYVSGINNVNNANEDLFLTLFNSDAASSSTDPDLLVGKGNIAIIHERNNECDKVRNTCTDPDDRYESSSNIHGGFMFVQFSQPVSVHSIGLADIENTNEQRGQFGFINSAGSFLGYKNMTALGNGSYTEQTSYKNSQTMTQASAGDLISYIVIKMKGSGGINDIKISRTTPTAVPEPTSIVMLGLGLLMMARLRRS